MAVDGTEDVVALPPRGRLDKRPGETPDQTQKGTQDKVRGVDKENSALARASLFQPGLKLGLLELEL